MTGFSNHVRQFIFARSEGYCEVMASDCDLAATEIHHRRPRAMGGTNRPETNYASNGLAICRKCHLRCESSRNWARDNGFILLQSDDPADVPVWWRTAFHRNRKAFVFLTDSGDKLEVGSGRKMETGTGV